MKIPKAEQLPSGSWRVRLRLGGESISITEQTERRALSEAMRIKADYIDGQRQIRASGMTVGQAVDRFIDRRSNVLSPSTIRTYRGIRAHAMPEIMDALLSPKIDLQSAVNRMAGKYSAKSVRNAYGLISAAYHDNNMQPPRVNLPQVARSEHAWLEPDQIRIFVDAVRGEPVEMAALLGLHGLRRSEILALVKENCTGGVIRVRGAVVYGENNKRIEKKTNKNRTSARDVPIMIPRLADLIEAAPDGPLVSDSPDTIRRRVNRICRQNDLPPVGTHGLRHSFASLAYHLGLPEREAMEIGGWSNEQTMRKIYTHIGAATRARSITTIKSFFEGEA